MSLSTLKKDKYDTLRAEIVAQVAINSKIIEQPPNRTHEFWHPMFENLVTKENVSTTRDLLFCVCSDVQLIPSCFLFLNF